MSTPETLKQDVNKVISGLFTTKNKNIRKHAYHVFSNCDPTTSLRELCKFTVSHPNKKHNREVFQSLLTELIDKIKTNTEFAFNLIFDTTTALLKSAKIPQGSSVDPSRSVYFVISLLSSALICKLPDSKERLKDKLLSADPVEVKIAATTYLSYEKFDAVEAQKLVENELIAAAFYPYLPNLKNFNDKSKKGTQLRSLFISIATQHSSLREPIMKILVRIYHTREVWEQYRPPLLIISEIYLELYIRYGDKEGSSLDAVLKDFPWVIPSLIECLRQGNFHSGIPRLLASFQQPAVSNLIALLDQKHTLGVATKTLVDMGTSTIEPLIKAADTFPKLRPQIKKILGKIGTPATLAIINWASKSLNTNGKIDLYLTEIFPVRKKVIKILCDFLSDKDLGPTAIALLAFYPNRAVPVLTTLLNDSQRKIPAVQALLLCGEAGADVVLSCIDSNELLANALSYPRLTAKLLLSLPANFLNTYQTLILNKLSEILDRLDSLGVDQKDKHPMSVYLKTQQDILFDRKLVLAFKKSPSLLLKELLIARGILTLPHIRFLLSDNLPEIRKHGEEIVVNIALSNKKKFPWIASLYAGDDLLLQQSVIKLLASMKLPEAFSLFQRSILMGTPETTQELALDGIAKLVRDSQCSAAETLYLVVKGKNDKLSLNALTVLFRLNEKSTKNTEALQERLSRTDPNSELGLAIKRMLRTPE